MGRLLNFLLFLWSGFQLIFFRGPVWTKIFFKPNSTFWTAVNYILISLVKKTEKTIFWARDILLDWFDKEHTKKKNRNDWSQNKSLIKHFRFGAREVRSNWRDKELQNLSLRRKLNWIDRIEYNYRSRSNLTWHVHTWPTSSRQSVGCLGFVDDHDVADTSWISANDERGNCRAHANRS